MSEYLQPPCLLTDAEAFRANVQSDCQAWLDYLVTVDAYMRKTAIEKLVLEQTIRITEREHEAALGILRAEMETAREFYFDRLQAVPASAAPAATRLTERVPDPEAFYGDANDLRRFENEVIQKLETNSDRYTTPNQRVTYVMRLCKSMAQKTVQARVVRGRNDFGDYQDVLALLHKAYGNPDLLREARNKLYAVRQGADEDFSSFILEFERLAFEADADLKTLAPILEKALNRHLSVKLGAERQIPTDYHEFSTLLQRYDRRRIQIAQREIDEANRLSSRQNMSAPMSSTAMTSAEHRPLPAPTHALMLPTATPEQTDFYHMTGGTRKDRNECFRCGSSDHRVKYCPLPDNRPAQVRYVGDSCG